MGKISKQRSVHKIDAKGRVLGRLASEIAVLLRGKHKVEYLPYLDLGDIVHISNVSKLKVTGKKAEQKSYFSHSGYPGGIKERKYKTLFSENPQEILRKAVYNMLPKNRLRQEMIKRLRFVESKKVKSTEK